MKQLFLILIIFINPVFSDDNTGGTIARVIMIRAKPGLEKEFEAGYKRHLDWRRGKNDSWRWQGWSFVLGPRAGSYLLGTFQHDWTDFDQALPANEEASDLATNVVPYSQDYTVAQLSRLRDFSSPEEVPTLAPLIEIVTYELRPGAERAFELLLAGAVPGWKQRHPNSPFAWYKTINGDVVPTYIFMQALNRWSDLRESEPFFADSRETNQRDIIKKIESGVLRFRNELSLLQ